VKTHAELADDFLMLEYEAHQNGNCNFCFFPESADRFRAMAVGLLDALKDRLQIDELDEDEDKAWCLLAAMIEDSPRELPITDDEQYQALRRVLTRLGILT
jgi:hypothetical protein